MRSAGARDGSERLCAAIERLVAKTADSLNIPDEWSHRPLAFARAYLGMEVT